jgi:hypothetical protein
MGEHAEIAAEIRSRRASSNASGQNITIEDIDHLLSTNEVTFEGFDTLDDEFQQSPNGLSKGNSDDAMPTKTKKRGKKVVEEDNNCIEISKSISQFVQVFDSISKSTNEFIQLQKPIAAEDLLWAQLEEIGVKPELNPDLFMFLVENPSKLKFFNATLVNKCKEMLQKIMSSHPHNF